MTALGSIESTPWTDPNLCELPFRGYSITLTRTSRYMISLPW